MEDILKQERKVEKCNGSLAIIGVDRNNYQYSGPIFLAFLSHAGAVNAQGNITSTIQRLPAQVFARQLAMFLRSG